MRAEGGVGGFIIPPALPARKDLSSMWNPTTYYGYTSAFLKRNLRGAIWNKRADNNNREEVRMDDSFSLREKKKKKNTI